MAGLQATASFRVQLTFCASKPAREVGDHLQPFQLLHSPDANEAYDEPPRDLSIFVCRSLDNADNACVLLANV